MRVCEHKSRTRNSFAAAFADGSHGTIALLLVRHRQMQLLAPVTAIQGEDCIDEDGTAHQVAVAFWISVLPFSFTTKVPTDILVHEHSQAGEAGRQLILEQKG